MCQLKNGFDDPKKVDTEEVDAGEEGTCASREQKLQAKDKKNPRSEAKSLLWDCASWIIGETKANNS